MIYASGDNNPEVKQKLQNCIKKYKFLVQNDSFENQYWQN